MSEESILLIDQMEANGESPEAIAEVLRKKEEEEKKFDPFNDLMNKINNSNNKVVKQVVKAPLEGTSPLAEDVSYEYDPEPYYTVEKTDGTKEKVYDPKSHYIKNTFNKITGETTKTVVSSKDVPTSFIKKVKKDIKSRIDKDINSVSAKEFMDLFQTDKDDVSKIEKQINKEVNDYLDIENMDMPTAPSSTVLPKNVMDAEGNIREYTAADSRNAYDQEITNYKKLREDNQNSVFASYLRKADEAFKQNFQSPSEEGRIELAKELYLRDEKAKFIKRGLTQWIEDNIDWGDTFVSGAKTFRDFKWILDKANISALPEEQRIFLDKLKDYYDEIGYKTTVDGKRIEPPKIVKTKQTLQIQEDFINLNKDDLILKRDEIKEKELNWKNKFEKSNNELEKYKDIPSVLNDLEDLQNKMQSFSELTDEEGRLDEENYSKYKVIYDEYHLLLNENKEDITSYQNAVTNHNQLVEQYNTPYIDTDGKEWKNELEYDYSNYNSILDKTNTMVRSYQLLNDDLLDQIEDSGDLDIFINSLSRNHSEVAQFATYLKTKGVDLAMGVESAVFHVTKAPRRLIFEPIWNDFLVENGYIDENGNINEVTQAVFETMENASPLFGVIPIDRNEVRTAINNFQEQRLKGVQERTTWDDAKGGSLYDWGEYIVGASADFIPQLAALVTAPQVGLITLSSSAAGMKFEEMLEKNKHGGSYSMWDMYIASGVTFGAEYLTERFVTLPLIEAAGGKNILRNGFRAGMRNLLNPKNILTGVTGATLESGSEVLATMGENFGMILAGDKISIYKGIDEAAFNGLLMERIIKAPRVFKQVVYPFLPKSELSKLTDSAKKIREIESQLKNPNLAPETRKILKERIARIVADNTKVLTKAIDRIDEMTPEQRRLVFDTDIKFVETLELIRNIKEDGSISTEAKQNLIKEITDEYYKLEKQKNDMLDEINMRQDEEVSKKTTEKLQERGVKTGFNIAQTPQEFYEIYVRETGDTQTPSHVIRSKDGFFTPGGMWVSNRTRAKETGAISVASHEVLHAITESTFHGDVRIVKDKQGNDVEVTITEEGVKLIKDFLGKLSSKERAVLDKRMDGGTERYIRDKDDNIIGEKAFEQYAHEYITYYSDAIRLNQINPKKDVLNRIKEPFINLFKLRGYDNIEFKDGNSVRNFIIDYAADVKAGEVRESILAIAGPGGAKIGELKFSETEINDQNVLEDVKDIRTRQAEMDRIAKERGVDPIKDQRSMRLEASVIDAIKTPVNKIAETLTKKLYDPIAIDARGDISRNDYRESLKSELNNMVIREYDGRQGVEKFIVNRGWKRAQSLARRLGIESVQEYGGKGIMKRSDALDNAYEAGEDVGINFEAAREKVQSMLDAGQITQRRADDLLAQLKEIENDKAGQEVETGKTRRILGIKDNSALYNEVLEEVRNILGPINFDEVLTNKKTEKKFRQALEKAFLKTEFAKKVKKLIGTQKSDKFKKLLETKQNEIQTLVGVKYANRFKGENALVESLGRLGVQESAETQASLEGSFVMNEKGGNETWALKEMTPQQFQDIFIKGRETQYKSLVNALVNELGLDAVFHPGVLPEGVTKESAKLTEAIKRNPSARFSETASDNVNEAASMVSHKKFKRDIPIIVAAANNHGWGTNEFEQEVYSNSVDPATIMELEADGFHEKFAENPTKFKMPLLKYFNKKNPIVNLYSKDKTGDEVGQQQYADGILELMDYLPPSFIKALGKTYFGLKGAEKIDKEGDYDASNLLRTYSVIPKDRYKEINDKFEKRIKEKDQENLPFDVNAIRIINSGYGLAKKIRDIQFSQLNVNEKIKKYKAELIKEVEAANINNPLANQYIHEKILEILANPDISIETKAGLIRVQESASSNTKAQRGLTTVTGVQWYSKTQAPYVGIATKDKKIDGFEYKKGDKVGVASEADAKKHKLSDVKINDNHPDYKAAVRSANERIGKILTILNSKEGGLKKWRAIKNGELFDQYLEKVLNSYIVDHLRMKGEHAKPSSNMLRESTIELLNTVEKLQKDPNDLDARETFRNKFKNIIRSYTQIFGAEINSWEQDQELTTTSDQDLARMFVLNNIKDLNINSFYGATNKNINLNGENLISESIAEIVRFSETTVETVSKEKLDDAKVISNAIKNARTIKFSETPKGITVLDFDDTLATTESLVRFTAPDGTTGTLNAEQYAATYQNLLGKGYKFDFSEFNKVVKGKLAPLFNKALKLQKKFGPKNMFVLTARPPAAQKPIFDFLKANGLNIPLKNITGLGNSTSEAKALWIADKVGEGYNDFYFADDALQNVQAVQNMLDQFDVKSKVQQAKVKFSESSLSTKQNLNWKEDSIGYMTTNFNVDGKNYKITLYPTDLNNTNYELEFDLVTEYGLTQEMTGTGSQFKVLGIVYNGLLDVIKQKPNIETVGFSALTKDKSRARVYTILMDKLGKKLGWKTDIYEYGSGTQLDFEVVKPKTRKVKIKTTESIRNIPAVKNMLNQSDIKSPTQQAKIKFSETMDGEFNSILEETTGMQSEKEFSAAKAKLRGKGKGRFDFFIPPSAEDFKGLLYRFLAKGKKGDLQMAWFKKALLDPFARGYRELNEAKQRMWNDYNALRKAMPDVRKKLTKKIEGQKDFRYSDAVRVYLWDKAGFEIPGLSKSDKAMLLEVINNDQRLKDYAGVLSLISKRPEGYVEPSREWLVGNIMSDLEGANKVNRAEFLAEWIENKDIIFSEKNLNKIEAIYGANFREALEDMLYRMEKGTNRVTGSNRLVNAFQNWINNSVGAIMFFNARSAVLQTLSTVNFINWGDNNIAKAAMAFANQKQFWKDFTFLFNSDMLKQRRKGLKTDVNTAELTEAVGRSKNPVMAALNYLLQKGFLPTQIADSFAISSGGATFYRNRVNTYLKEGLSQKEAETKAFEDFQEIAEETQQSSRPDLISQQQASTLGRLILAFQNTPMQYMRLTKKAISDLVNGRGDWKTNISRILYYGAVQNVIFFSLQSALFALAFDDDEDDEKRAKTEEKKMQRLYNGILDSILRGTGVGGAVISTIKNMIIKFGEEEGKGWNRDFDNVVVEGLQLSPPIGSKIRKLRSAGRSWNYNRDVINKMDTFDIDNPIWDAIGNVVSAFTNVPTDRIINKTKNIRESLNEDNATWQRIALMLGWNRWDLNVKSDKIELVKTIVKEEKKQKAKEKREEKKKEEEALKQLEIDNTIKEEIKEEKEAEEKGEKKKEYTCANINSKGKRCSIVVPKAGMRCTIHEKVEQRVDGKKSQCKKIKNDGKRCKMQTSNKSGLCYYHD